MRSLRALAAAAAFSFVALSASAATITGGVKSVDITCTGSCEFWDLGLSPDGFNALDGDWLSGGVDNSQASREALVESILGIDVVLSSSSDTDTGAPLVSGFNGDDDPGLDGFTTSAEYILAWGGFDPRYILIRNFTADNEFTWNGTGSGSGLSGVDGFGVVPLPAAGWLLLGGIAGLAAMRRRRN